MTSELDQLIKEAKARWEAMSPEQRNEMLRTQAESWARSEAQWAKDFREGRCIRD